MNIFSSVKAFILYFIWIDKSKMNNAEWRKKILKDAIFYYLTSPMEIHHE
ncbi:MAG: hypothetical protein WCO98_10695 [bacterium]